MKRPRPLPHLVKRAHDFLNAWTKEAGLDELRRVPELDLRFCQFLAAEFTALERAAAREAKEDALQRLRAVKSYHAITDSHIASLLRMGYGDKARPRRKRSPRAIPQEKKR